MRGRVRGRVKGVVRWWFVEYKRFEMAMPFSVLRIGILSLFMFDSGSSSISY